MHSLGRLSLFGVAFRSGRCFENRFSDGRSARVARGDLSSTMPLLCKSRRHGGERAPLDEVLGVRSGRAARGRSHRSPGVAAGLWKMGRPNAEGRPALGGVAATAFSAVAQALSREPFGAAAR